ncbi:MAG TPA: peptidyl-alpha-hydroxyglycine alpha-amidating lyase family protein [Xanthobacteraceae bacterium]|nr:peptidyl-alpha-hydroxyglycine alpha-amidating lyase family protein [Xanthobacteraceae bacterium]
MRYPARPGTMLALAAVAAIATAGGRASAQAVDPNSAPNPYHVDASWAPQLPAGRQLGAPIGVSIDKDGKSIWVFERCGADTCEGSSLAPIMKFDPSGKLVANFGGGMINWPHGFSVDRDDNVWETDGRGGNGKGHTAIKFAPDGKVLMTLGKPGMPGNADDQFNTPSDVFTGPNGDIFVADGHGVMNKLVTNDRIAKFSKDGKFIKAWSKHGPAKGELDTPHKLAIDSQNRLFVADRVNSRIQIFDLDGRLLTEWKQFGRPSSVWIDKNDVIYVADSQSDEKTNPGVKQGIRIGSVKDGKVTAFIPLVDPQLGSAEEVAADDQGNVFAGFTNKKMLKKYVKN